MFGLNSKSIDDKVRAYFKTAECKNRIKQRINEYKKNGVKETQAGSKVISAKAMESAAIKLANAISKSASASIQNASGDSSSSVIDNINSITASRPYKMPDGSYRVDLYFTADLSRESLYSDGYDGVVNIIALFNNGYLASNNVYGFWDNHSQAGEWNTLRTNPGDNFAYIRSKISRPALQFMQHAVNDFNSTIGASIGATAILADIYNEIPTTT